MIVIVSYNRLRTVLEFLFRLSLLAKLKQWGLYMFADYFMVSMENVLATWDLDGRVENDRWILEHFTLLEPEVGSNTLYIYDVINGVNVLSEYFEQLAHIL